MLADKNRLFLQVTNMKEKTQILLQSQLVDALQKKFPDEEVGEVVERIILERVSPQSKPQ